MINDKIKEKITKEIKELCKDDDFCMMTALVAVGSISCFLASVFIHRAFSYGFFGLIGLYGSVIVWLILVETIKAYGESND